VILALNRGSSSIKFAVYGDDLDRPAVSGNRQLQEPDIIEELERQDLDLHAVGHRVVHGSTAYLKPTLVTPTVLAMLKTLIPLAPEHLPAEIALIESVAGRRPDLPQVVCFDTAFHRTMPRVARLYGLPSRLAEEGIERYGFHGLSYEYVAGELPRGRVVAAHLGNGASLAAIRDGVSMDTSMGFTPAGGMIMGTRSGDLDPAVVVYLMEEKMMTLRQIGDLVNRQSGLLGLSGLVGSLAGVFVGSAFIDRYDRRTTLVWTQLASIGVAAILFSGALSGHPPLWLLHAANLGTWFLAAIHGPARQAAIPRLLSEEEIPAASALNQAGWQVGSIVGPALAGVVIAVSGVAWAYGVDLASYVFSFVVALLLAPIPLGEEIVERGMKAVAEGLQYLRNHRLLQSTFVVDLVAMIFGSPQALYPVIAAQQLHRGPEVVGLLFAAPAAGALLMTLASGSVTGLRRQGDAIVWAVVAWGAAITGFGLSGTHLVPALVCLAAAGAADVVSAIFRSTILQVTVPDRLRGRLSSVFFVVVTGGPKLGDIESGLVAGAFGATVSVITGGLLTIVGAFVVARVYPELPDYRTRTEPVA